VINFAPLFFVIYTNKYKVLHFNMSGVEYAYFR